MLRGYYTAASGIVTQEKRLNTIANNIANVSTAGYKKDDLTLSTFGEHIAVRMNTYNQTPLIRHGRGVWMQVTDSKYTDYTQGGFEYTGRPLDMALQGDGFFVVSAADGDRLTRDGQFAIDAEGYLVLPGFGRVQGENGDIQVGQSDFTVSGNGTIYLPPEDPDDEIEALDRLIIALPEDYTELEKTATGLYEIPGYITLGENDLSTTVLQGQIERSNVNMGEEMTRMLNAQRSLQSASQIVKMYDELSEQINTRISRMN